MHETERTPLLVHRILSLDTYQHKPGGANPSSQKCTTCAQLPRSSEKR
jgi:hypothetical protein